MRKIRTTLAETPLTVRTNDWRAYWIWRQKGSQYQIVKTWKNYLTTQVELFIDAGANYGEFSAALCNQAKRIIAIEPNPRIFTCLNVTLQSCQQVKIVNIAIGDHKEQFVKLYYKPSMSGFSSLNESVVGSQSSDAKLNEKVYFNTVPMDTLDNIILELNDDYPGSFILKIDIEGYEPEALKGSSELIKNAKWWRAIIEFNPNAIQDRELDIFKVWDYYRQFPGYIIEERSSLDVCNDIENYRLPTNPPCQCNILIGRGLAL